MDLYQDLSEEFYVVYHPEHNKVIEITRNTDHLSQFVILSLNEAEKLRKFLNEMLEE